MKKLNSKGFGLVETILILVIVGIIGSVGWYVWHSKQATDNSYNNSGQSNISSLPAIKTFDDCKKAKGSILQTTYPEVCVTSSGKRFTNPNQSIQTEDSTASWLEYQPPDKVYKIRLADGWKLYHYTDTSIKNNLESDKSSETVYKAGTKADVVIRNQGGRGGLAYFTLSYNRDDGYCAMESSTQETFSTNAGLAGTKYSYDSTKDKNADSLYGKYQEFSYLFKKDKKTVCITFDQFSNDSSSRPATVEQVVKTLEL